MKPVLSRQDMVKKHFVNSQSSSTGPGNSFQSWFREGRSESPLPNSFRKPNSLAPKLLVVSTPPSFLVKVWDNTVGSYFLPTEGRPGRYPVDYSWKVTSLFPSSFRGERESRVWLGIPLSRNKASR